MEDVGFSLGRSTPTGGEIMTRSRTIAWFIAAAVLAGCGDASQTLEPGSRIGAGEGPSWSQGSGQGLVRTTWPSGEDPGPPYYARIYQDRVFIVDGWAVVPFYRDPTCIRPDFNLLGFIDIPAAFGCALTVEGFHLWHWAPFASPPKIAQKQGTGAVPYWFIPAEAVLEAMQHERLTIGALAAIPGRIVGHASQFTETLHPQPDPENGGGHPAPKLIQNAHGTLEDSRRFQFDVVVVQGAIRTIRLRFW
jgi:hypothetical protein